VRIDFPNADVSAHTFVGLPDGVASIPFAPDPGNARTAAVFEAKEDAPLGAWLITPTLDSTKLPSPYEQSVPIVVVENDRSYWRTELHCLPIVVVERLPYSIEVEEPKRPLIRSSDGHLRVHIKRDKDFDNRIQIRLLNPPPGVRGSTVSADRGREFVDLPLSHSGGVPSAPWTMVVLAQCTISGRATEIASNPVSLRVERPLFDVTIPSLRADVGQTVLWPITLKNRTPFLGEARLEVRGLPSGVSATVPPVTKDTEELSITLTIPPATQPILMKSLQFRFHIPSEDGTILQDSRSGPFRLLPPSPTELDATGNPNSVRGTVENPKT
jgi:hypothetical protein